MMLLAATRSAKDIQCLLSAAEAGKTDSFAPQSTKRNGLSGGPKLSLCFFPWTNSKNLYWLACPFTEAVVDVVEVEDGMRCANVHPC